MNRSLPDIATDTVQALTAAGYPPDVVARVHSFLLQTLSPVERERERARLAAELMPMLGAEGAAERLGCHRSTVYRRARRNVCA